jgi:hypothetical protein
MRADSKAAMREYLYDGSFPNAFLFSSFIFEFLPLAIQQPWLMAAYRRHFAFLILAEGHLRAIFAEEIGRAIPAMNQFPCVIIGSSSGKL